MSKVIRLNQACENYIDNIRNVWLNGFKDSKLKPNKSLFSDTYIIRLALSEYYNYLENNKEEWL